MIQCENNKYYISSIGGLNINPRSRKLLPPNIQVTISTMLRQNQTSVQLLQSPNNQMSPSIEKTCIIIVSAINISWESDQKTFRRGSGP